MKLTKQEKKILSRYECTNEDFDKRIRHKDFKKMDKLKFLWNLMYCIFHKSSTAYIAGRYYYFDLNK